MEDILPVCVYSAYEGSVHFHIGQISLQNTSVTVDGSPLGTVQTVCVVQLFVRGQRVGQQIGFSALALEFGCRSLLWHRLYLQVGVVCVLAELQSAVYKLTACCLLTVDSYNIVCSI